MALEPRIAKALRAAAVVAAMAALWGVGFTAVRRATRSPSAARPDAGADAPPAAPPAALEREPLGELPTRRDELRARLARGYAMPADARFVRARGALRRFGAPAAPPAASGASARDDLAQLVSVARAGATQPAAPRVAHVSALRAEDAVAALRSIEGASPSVARLRAHMASAARALAVVAFETPDLVGVADSVAANALAACALARADGAAAPDAEALLFYAMGYGDDARAAAEALPPTDPVRAFVRGEEVPPSEAPGARYLLLRRAIEREDDVAVRVWVAEATETERASVGVTAFVARSLRRSSDLESRAQRYRAMLPAAVESLAREHGAAASEEGAIRRAAAMIAGDDPRAPLLGGVLADRVAATTLSALEERLSFELDARGSRRDAVDVLRAAEGDAPFLRAWLRVSNDRAAAAAGRARADALLAHARDVAGTPAPLRVLAWSLYQDLARRAGEPDAASLSRFIATLDARPAHREAALALLIEEGLDLPQAEALCASLPGTVLPARWPRVWCARLERDLRETDEAAEARLRAAADASTAWSPARAALSEWLLAHGRAAEVSALAGAFLAGHADDPTLEPVFARVALAKAERARGDLAAAWRALEPALPTMQQGAMLQAVAVRVAQGSLDEALALARRAHARYGDLATAARLAEVQWRSGHLRDAATTLAEVHAAGDAPGWTWDVAPAFTAVFGAQRAGNAAAAAEVLRGAGVGDAAVEAIALHLARAGDVAQGLAVHETIPARGADAVAVLLTRYGLHALARGAAFADAWLAQQVPPASQGALAAAAFARGNDALVWSAADSTPGTWLLRAATTRRSPSLAARSDEIAAAVAGSEDQRAQVARMLIGRESAEAMTTLGRTEAARVEVAYWAGYYAHTEGDLGEAADWYRLVARHGDPAQPEVRLARATLARWFAQDRHLAAVEDPWVPAAATRVEAEAPAPQAPERAPRRRHRERAR